MNLADNDRSRRRALTTNREGPVGKLQRAVAFRAVVIMQFEDGVALRQLIAGLGHQHDSNAVIDWILDPIAARTENDRGPADQFSVESRQIPGCIGPHQMTIGCSRQAVIIVDNVRIPALRLDDPPESIAPRPRRNRSAY